MMLAALLDLGAASMPATSRAADADAAAAAAAACDRSALPAAALEAAAALERDPGAAALRLRLADTYAERRCYDEAVRLLEADESRDGALQSRLRQLRSLQAEQDYFEGLGRAEEVARTQRNLLRCTKLADLSACDAALRSAPNDASLLIARGDALVAANRLGDAQATYRRAAAAGGSAGVVSSKLAEAEARRQSLASRCQSGSGEDALEACDFAMLRGAADEFALLKRKGTLLQELGRPLPALDAYLAANLLRKDDESVALAIVALTDRTRPNDALALAARGSALLTLGRASESVAVLRRAQTLSPALPGLRDRLAAAQRLARNPPPRNAAADSGGRQGPSTDPAPRTYSNDAPAGRAQ